MGDLENAVKKLRWEKPLETPEQLAERMSLAIMVADPPIADSLTPLIRARDKALLDEVERRIESFARVGPFGDRPIRSSAARSAIDAIATDIRALRSELGK